MFAKFENVCSVFAVDFAPFWAGMNRAGLPLPELELPAGSQPRSRESVL